MKLNEKKDFFAISRTKRFNRKYCFLIINQGRFLSKNPKHPKSRDKKNLTISVKYSTVVIEVSFQQEPVRRPKGLGQ